MKELEKLLEQVTADLMMTDHEDLPGMARLHDLFENIIRTIDDDANNISRVVQNCADLVEKIVLNEVSDRSVSFMAVTDAIIGLQKVVRGENSFVDIVFSEEVAIIADVAPIMSPNGGTASFGEFIEAGGRGEVAEPVESKEVNNAPVGEYIIDPSAGDASLLADFINEAREHCATAEQCLMDLETGSDNNNAINAVFRAFHTIKGAAGFLDLKPILELAHESETLLDLGRKGTVTIEGEVADAAFDAVDALRKLFDGLEQALTTGQPFDGSEVMFHTLDNVKRMVANPDDVKPVSPDQRVGDILVSRKTITQEQIDRALANRAQPDEKLGETLVKQGLVEPKKIARALRDQKSARKETSGKAIKEMVKIDTERLDRLVDTIGELVIAESMVGHDNEILSIASSKVSRNIAHLNKITRELQEMGMAMRLVPVKPTFQKLARAVRDLTKKSGKDVDLIMSGEDTEVDRSIIEQIGDPLMHMIRNSVDHGIESTEQRIAADKSATGKVWLRAFHKGGNVHFEIEDDGMGLDKDLILTKAREKGLIDGNRELTDKEIFALIFHPGFSTAKRITDISGRGVGMDVVKKNLESMRGHLDIESVSGQGTKFTMKLPLTLAIIDGMLVSVEAEKYIIPTLSIVESLVLTPKLVSTVTGRDEMVNLRGDLIPLVRINQLFGLPSETTNDGDNNTVVVVEDSERMIGLVVNELLGQQQTVIKSLGVVFQGQKWISGGAILSDGTIGLIIDVGGVVNLAHSLRDELYTHHEQVNDINEIEESRKDPDMAKLKMETLALEKPVSISEQGIPL